MLRVDILTRLTTGVHSPEGTFSVRFHQLNATDVGGKCSSDLKYVSHEQSSL